MGGCIRFRSVKVLDDDDVALAETIEGLRRAEALIAVYLNYVREATSREIEEGTGLRQPEVSIAMKTFKKKGWVKERERRTSGKGRPMKVYRLDTDLEHLIGSTS